MSTPDDIAQERQQIAERLVRVDAERAKLAEELAELEAAERARAEAPRRRTQLQHLAMRPCAPSRPTHRARPRTRCAPIFSANSVCRCGRTISGSRCSATAAPGGWSSGTGAGGAARRRTDAATAGHGSG